MSPDQYLDAVLSLPIFYNDPAISRDGKWAAWTWYRHDLVTGERRVLARPEQSGYYEPKLNEQGTHILYVRQDRHPAGRQVWLVDIEGQQDREIINVLAPNYRGSTGFSLQFQEAIKIDGSQRQDTVNGVCPVAAMCSLRIVGAGERFAIDRLRELVRAENE